MRKNKNCIYVVNISKKRKNIAFFTFIFIFFAILYLYLTYIATPILIDNTSAKIKTITNKSIDCAVSEVFSNNIKYDDVITINKDNNGNIKTMNANTSKVNYISRSISQITLDKIIELSQNSVLINIGAFTGISVFSGLGPKVKFNFTPYGDVVCKFKSVFTSAGINQTQHKIYLNVDFVVRVIFPFRNVEVKGDSNVLVCESVIIGEIPEIYLNSNNLTEMLNLIP